VPAAPDESEADENGGARPGAVDPDKGDKPPDEKQQKDEKERPRADDILIQELVVMPNAPLLNHRPPEQHADPGAGRIQVRRLLAPRPAPLEIVVVAVSVPVLLWVWPL